MKIVKGGQYPAPRAGGPVLSRTQMQKALARQHAMEKSLAKYISISCGHSTDIETQAAYGFARPKRGMVFCEICAKWLRTAKPVKAPPPPQEPLFLWRPTSNALGVERNARTKNVSTPL